MYDLASVLPDVGVKLFVSVIVVVTAYVALKYYTSSWLHSLRESPIPYTIDWPTQCESSWQGKVLGRPSLTSSSASGSKGTIQCYCPANGQLLGQEMAATQNGIDRAIIAARDAQLSWSSTTFAERRRVLRTLLQFILTHQDQIANVACLDTGKTKIDALFGEILVTCAKLEWTLLHGERALKPDRSRPTSLLMFYKSTEIRYEPLGVVGACVSWNYPFHNLLGPVISALFTGNAIVVKASEQTAWSSRVFCNIVTHALMACGHSKDLVKVVICWPETAEYFTSHPGVSHLTFIGSRPVAQKVCASAAKSVTPLVVELGGKDAAIVLDDVRGKQTGQAEMGRVASIIMRGVFQSAGQNCVGIERVIAMPRAYDALLDMLTSRIGALRVGDPRAEEVDVGAMISDASFDRLEKLVADAVRQGATLIHGGKRYNDPKVAKGHYFQPTLIAHVTSSMRLAQEEVFAPICVLMRAETVDEAISMANSTSYGLGCSVFGPCSSISGRQMLDKVTHGVKSGMVAVNDFGAYYTVQLPFGGVSQSGYGRFAGAEGLRGLCNAKSICRDRWNGLIKTTIPSGLDYPMRGSAWAMGKGVVCFAYSLTWREKVAGIIGMVRQR